MIVNKGCRNFTFTWPCVGLGYRRKDERRQSQALPVSVGFVWITEAGYRQVVRRDNSKEGRTQGLGHE